MELADQTEGPGPADDANPSSLSKRQEALRKELCNAISVALPEIRRIDDALRSAGSPYRHVALVLVALRHEFPSPDGQPYDLRGRSSNYRAVVRSAYAQAGADPCAPLSKRLTAATAYWVRKLLLEKYGLDQLRAMGIVQRGNDRRNDLKSRTIHTNRSANITHTLAKGLVKAKLRDLEKAVGTLNSLASDPQLVPTEELVRAAIRAVSLLSRKIARTTGGDTLEVARSSAV